MDCSPPGFSVHRVLQARILEWLAMPFSRGSSWPLGWIWVFCIAGRLLTIWATKEALFLVWVILNSSFSLTLPLHTWTASNSCCLWDLYQSDHFPSSPLLSTWSKPKLSCQNYFNSFLTGLSTSTFTSLQFILKSTLTPEWHCYDLKQGFPGDSMVRNLPANEGDTGLIPRPGRFHMLQSN